MQANPLTAYVPGPLLSLIPASNNQLQLTKKKEPEASSKKTNPKTTSTLMSPNGSIYTLTALLGKGSHSQVFKATRKALQAFEGHTAHIPNEVAIKISTPCQKGYLFHLREEQIICHLNRNQQEAVVKVFEGFSSNPHPESKIPYRYTVYESLSKDLFQVLRERKFQGFPLEEIKIFARQLLNSLQFLFLEGVIHCDLKPNNILLVHPKRLGVKLIDFGMASWKPQGTIAPIQCTSYRAPEAAMAYPYDPALLRQFPYRHSLDMWSLGCVLAFLFKGSHILYVPSNNDIDLENKDVLTTIAKNLGPFPEEMLRQCKFAHDEPFLNELRAIGNNQLKHLLFKSKKKAHSKEDPPKELTEEELLFLDFVQQMLTISPENRITAQNALNHPFLADLPCPEVASQEVAVAALAPSYQNEAIEKKD